jgi:hypothetical protein
MLQGSDGDARWARRELIGTIPWAAFFGEHAF